MFSRTRSVQMLALAALGLAVGCAKEPALNVQQQSAAPAAQAQPAAPESAAAADAMPTTPAGAPGMVSSRGAATPQELPAGHPPTGGMPAGHPPIDAAAQGAIQIAPVAPGTGQGATALVWTAPASWVAEPPSNSMRRAQYKVPGPGGDGECVVFYFGPGQGGDAMSNAERWASQFLGADGQPAKARTRTSTVNGIEILHVEAAGTYQSGSMMGMGQGVAKPGWALLGAVANGPDANWFFKFTAPATTLEANRAAFDAMTDSLRRGG
jgi:hypothetical protein